MHVFSYGINKGSIHICMYIHINIDVHTQIYT